VRQIKQSRKKSLGTEQKKKEQEDLLDGNLDKYDIRDKKDKLDKTSI
jgi:hypothetical protein